MKYYLSILALACIGFTYSQADPVIMTVGDKKVTKSEFLQIYLKNNPNPVYDQQSLDDYMELFKKFQLKVAEAEAKGYDTVPALKRELAGYQKQLSLPYLTDSSVNEFLVKEAYKRTTEEIRASHILIKLDPNAKPTDTLEAFNRIMDLRKQIINGSEFELVAKGKRGSEDPSVSMNGGDLGYFTAFQMVYPFEEAAFNTKVGDVSMPIRTKFGYHIIQVKAKRPSRGTIQAAHIMIAAPKSFSDSEVESAERKIQEIYEKLQAGENFEEMAQKYSEDPSTASRGGILPVFGTGASTRMVSNFEDAAFAIQEDGAFSEPIQTDYGFHIIKRISLAPLRSYDEMKKELQLKVNKDERAQKTQKTFIEKLKNQYDYKDKSKGKLIIISSSLDSADFYKGQWDGKVSKEKTLFKLDKKKYSTSDYAQYLKNNHRTVKNDNNSRMVQAEYVGFVNQSILNLEESKLEAKYPAYKALLQEYHDGILLYEIMSDEVWTKAIQDTSGLKAYFEKNRVKYQWKERYNAVVYECGSEEIAKMVYSMILIDTINSKDVLEKMNEKSELNVKVRTNKYEWEDTDFLSSQKLNLGANYPYQFDGKFFVVKIEDIIAPKAKELNESKGSITSDYQNYLEEQWLIELKQKHPIVVNTNVLYSLGK